jgi:hypothetical protein
MLTDQEKLNRLLSRSGSVDELTRLATELPDDLLQKAVLHSEYARIEWERRISAIARRANILAIIAIIFSVIVPIVVAIVSRCPP